MGLLKANLITMFLIVVSVILFFSDFKTATREADDKILSALENSTRVEEEQLEVLRKIEISLNKLNFDHERIIEITQSLSRRSSR